MEVTAVEDMDTHVVFGTKDKKAFSLSSGSELIQVLSDALYSNKLLAVCREYVCNGWDAHAMNGATRPIEVTISATEIVFRDFGPGIADADMAPVFCTYGDSSKKKDENQIGGFGLGCKAGFAITATFTVTSFHNHTKTVYVASKGSAETNGFPDLSIVVQMPTTETGMEIRVPLNGANPWQARQYVLELARIAEREVNLHFINDPIKISEKDFIGLNQSKTGYLVVKADTCHNLLNGHRVLVRMGGVAYPVQRMDEYAHDYAKIVSVLTVSMDMVLIIDVPPGFVSLAPSREALSYNPTTLHRLTKKLKEIATKASVRMEQYITHLVRRSTKDYFDNLVFENDSVLAAGRPNAKLQGEQAYLTALLDEYPNDKRSFESFWDFREYCAMNPNINSGINRKYREEYHRRAKQQLDRHPMAAFLRGGDSPYRGWYRFISQAIGKDPKLFKALKRIEIRYSSTGFESDNSYYQIKHNYPTMLTKAVLYSSQNQMRAAIGVMGLEHGTYLGIPVSKDMDVKDLRTKLEKLGYEVYDTLHIKAAPRQKKEKSAEPVQKKLTGYASLVGIAADRNRLSRLSDPNTDRIDHPDMVLVRCQRNLRFIIEDYDDNKVQALAKLFPNAVVVSSSKTAKALRAELGIKHHHDQIVERYRHLTSQPDLLQKLDNIRVMKKMTEAEKKLYEDVYQDKLPVYTLADYVAYDFLTEFKYEVGYEVYKPYDNYVGLSSNIIRKRVERMNYLVSGVLMQEYNRGNHSADIVALLQKLL